MESSDDFGAHAESTDNPMIKQMTLYLIASHMHDKAGAADCEPPAIRSAYKLILEFADTLFRSWTVPRSVVLSHRKSSVMGSRRAASGP